MGEALNLAMYIVNKCINDEKCISNLQLQKILYFIQKEFLREDRIAFNDPIEAWRFGPVVPNVYYNYSGFGAMPITLGNEDGTVPERDRPTIDRIVEEKRILSPWDMVKETHKENGAWDKVYKNGSGLGEVISLDLIREEN